MFPIRDHNPSGRVPYVTYGLMAANILIYISYAGFIGDGARFGAFLNDWALIPAEVANGVDQHTVLTSMFLHGGFMHLAGNMLFLWIFGDNLEDALGHVPFLIFYLVCGLVADAAHIMSDPDSLVPLVGASGAIAGVMGGYLLLYPRAQVDVLLIFIVFFRVFTISAWIVLAIWFGIQIISGSVIDAAGGGVAYWAHAGGFLAGMVFILPLWLRLGGTGFWSRNDGHPPHPEQEIPEQISRIPVVRRRR